MKKFTFPFLFLAAFFLFLVSVGPLKATIQGPEALANMADTNCEILLTSAAPTSYFSSGPTFLKGGIDFLILTQGIPGLRYQIMNQHPDGPSSWQNLQAFQMKKIPGAPFPYQRYEFQIPLSAFTEKTDIRLIPFLHDPHTGQKKFDHNSPLTQHPLAHYHFDSQNAWTFAPSSTCQKQKLAGLPFWRFLQDMTPSLQGIVKANEYLTIIYDTHRLPKCRAVSAAYPIPMWGIKLEAQVYPSAVSPNFKKWTFPLIQKEGHLWMFAFKIPAEGRPAKLDLIFENYDAQGCKDEENFSFSSP